MVLPARIWTMEACAVASGSGPVTSGVSLKSEPETPILLKIRDQSCPASTNFSLEVDHLWPKSAKHEPDSKQFHGLSGPNAAWIDQMRLRLGPLWARADQLGVRFGQLLAGFDAC